MQAFALKRTVLLSALLLVLLAMAFFVWSSMTGNDHRTTDAYVNADTRWLHRKFPATSPASTCKTTSA